MDASLCCLDEYFSEWLREPVKSGEVMLAPPWSNMLRRIADQRHALNMHIEDLLANIKASVPRSKRRPTAERICHCGHLSQVMTEHLNLGLLDSRRPENRKEWTKSGVPLQAALRRGGKRKSRPWLGLANSKRAKRSADLRGGEVDFSAIVRECRAEQPHLFTTNDDSVSDDHDGSVQLDFDPMWYHGRRGWPVSEDKFKRMLDSCSITDTKLSKCARLRCEHAESIFVRNKATIDPSTSFTVRLPCNILHNGLCISDDADLFENSRLMASALERFFLRARLHRFWQLTCEIDGVAGEQNVFVNCFSHSFAQIPCAGLARVR